MLFYVGMRPRVSLIAAIGLSIAAFPGVALGDSSPVPLVSSNWAGYAVASAGTPSPTDPGAPTSTPDAGGTPAPTTLMTFTSVTGTWTQPKATCAAGSTSYSATWVGLGGLDPGSQALEQIGTDADCSPSGVPSYFAWYELVPAAPVNLKLKIVPGDTITTSVNVSGTSVLVQVKDRTRRTSFTKRLAMATPDLSSAEWIVEAPSECSGLGQCRPLPLANFGTVSFSRIATTANAHAGTITDPAWATSEIQLVPHPSARFGLDVGSSPAGATPSTVSSDGRTFTVSWQPNPAP